MIISLRSMSYEELKQVLTKDDKILVWSCDLCIKYCGLGGLEKARILEDMLKEDGYNVIGTEIVSESCLINLVKKHKVNKEEVFREATAIIVLACESGYECVKTVFNDKKVIRTMKTVGVGNFTLQGKVVLITPFEWTGIEPNIDGYTLSSVAEKTGLYATFFDAEKKPKPKLVTITINGKQYKAREGSNLLETLISLGFKIPHLCYKPELSPAGRCRLCLVKIKGSRRLLPACCTQVKEGMEIIAEDEELNELRKLILEMILAECRYKVLPRRSELQYWIRRCRVNKPSFKLSTEAKPIDYSSEVFIRNPNICILCGRCVRASAEISGQRVLDFAYRGSETQVVAELNKSIGQTDCAACMACVDSCPTGALTPKLIYQKTLNPVLLL